ncbi:uncharacterized protein TNCV_3934841 [Trichonephila clavipes]|nr:uncharacterized protein TNCV_3934841 [Trichonephila clavipes]
MTRPHNILRLHVFIGAWGSYPRKEADLKLCDRKCYNTNSKAGYFYIGAAAQHSPTVRIIGFRRDPSSWKRSVRAMQINVKRWRKENSEREVIKNSNVQNVRLEKLNTVVKKNTSDVGNYILVDFNQVNNLLRSAKSQYCEKQTLKLELGAKNMLTGYVVDFEVMSKVIAPWQKTSEASQVLNSEYGMKDIKGNVILGSSTPMEMEAAFTLWKRSTSLGFRYIAVSSDGDCKTFSYLCRKNVYGPDIVIKKEECIDHVSKRLGTALRSTVKDFRAQVVNLMVV